jgi:S1-C subfamily serine protease
MRALAAALCAAALIAAAGCARDDEGDDGRADGGGAVPGTVQRTTRVEVIRGLGDAEGGFDPERIYDRLGPGVVTVYSVLDEGGGGVLGLGGGGGDENRRQGVGSGFVVSEDGEVATNAHVVTDGEGGEIEEADEVYVAFADGNEVPAEIVGFDANSDIALLKLNPAGLTLRPLPLGTARGLDVGSPVVAIGSPFGEPQSLSVGVVSATDRNIESLTGFQTSGVIQTDAAINRGNSGGPLVNADGEVLGINSQIRTSSGGGEGVGYAVPVDTVERVIDALREDGEIDYAFLGVSTVAVFPQLAARFDLPVQAGAWVQQVVDDGPAGDAGLRAGGSETRFQARSYRPGGDIVTAVDGRALGRAADLAVALQDFEPGDEVTLEVYRRGRRVEIDVRLGARPAESRAALGEQP